MFILRYNIILIYKIGYTINFYNSNSHQNGLIQNILHHALFSFSVIFIPNHILRRNQSKTQKLTEQIQIPVDPLSDGILLSTDKYILVPTPTHHPSFLVINSTDFKYREVRLSDHYNQAQFGSLVQLKNGNVVYFHEQGVYILNSTTFQTIAYLNFVYYQTAKPYSFYDSAKNQQFLVFTEYDYGDYVIALDPISSKVVSSFAVANPFELITLTSVDTGVVVLSDNLLYKWNTFSNNRHTIVFNGNGSRNNSVHLSESILVFPSQNKFIVSDLYDETPIDNVFMLYSINVQKDFEVQLLQKIQLNHFGSSQFYEQQKTKITSDQSHIVFHTDQNQIYVFNMNDRSTYKLIDETTKKTSFSSFTILGNQFILNVATVTLSKVQIQLRNIKTGKLLDSYTFSLKSSFVSTKVIANDKNYPNFIVLIQLNNSVQAHASKIQNSKINTNFTTLDCLSMNSEYVDEYLVTSYNKSLAFFNKKLEKVLTFNYNFTVLSFSFLFSKNILVVKAQLYFNDFKRQQNDVFNFSNPIQKWHTNTFFALHNEPFFSLLLPTSGHLYTFDYYYSDESVRTPDVEVIDLKVKNIDEIVEIQNATRKASLIFDKIYINAGIWKEWGTVLIVDIDEKLIKVFNDKKSYQPITTYKLGNNSLYANATAVRVKLASSKKHIIIAFLQKTGQNTKSYLEVRNLNNLQEAQRFQISSFYNHVPADLSEGGLLTIAETNKIRIIKLT